MRIKHKLKSNRGFSLAETLLAVLILLLVSVIVASGIPTAQNVYNKVIVGANAQVALSTAVSALRNELGTAQKVQVGAGGTANSVLYFNSTFRVYSKLFLDGTPPTIMVVDYVDPDSATWAPIQKDADHPNTPRELVSDAAANKNLVVVYRSAHFDTTDPNVIVFEDIEVKHKDNPTGPALASLNELKIRVISVSE